MENPFDWKPEERMFFKLDILRFLNTCEDGTASFDEVVAGVPYEKETVVIMLRNLEATGLIIASKPQFIFDRLRISEMGKAAIGEFKQKLQTRSIETLRKALRATKNSEQKTTAAICETFNDMFPECRTVLTARMYRILENLCELGLVLKRKHQTPEWSKHKYLWRIPPQVSAKLKSVKAQNWNWDLIPPLSDRTRRRTGG